MPFLAEVHWVAVSSIATALAAVLAAVYVIFTYRLLKVQQDQSAPCVVVYTQHDNARSTIIMIIIENIGRSMARDVRFELDRRIPLHAFGLERLAGSTEEMDSGPLVRGIPALAPGETRRITWGQYGGLREALGGIPVKVTSRFKYGPREMDPVDCVLEVESFHYEELVDTDGARKCAGYLEKMERHLQQMSRKQKG
jgi:hypothetical protein